MDGQPNHGSYDGFVTRYSADGSQQWTRLVEGSNSESGFSVATGADGAVYLTGQTNGAIDGQTHSGDWDGFVIKYDTNTTQITFAAGSSTATLAVYATADQATENLEVLTVSVLAGDGYTLGKLF